MKNFALLLFSLNFVIVKAQNTDPEIAKVLLALDTQQECWNKGDIPCFMEYYWKNDSLKFIGKNGVTYGWQKVSDNYRKNYPDQTAMGKLDFTIEEASRLCPGVIFIVGKWQLTK